MNNKMLMIGIRFLSVIFWVSIISIFLWIPELVQRFYSTKSITILTWPTLIDAQRLQDFEKETGVKVFLRYFENNEELFAKIKETKGQGYDLIMPSDYMVDQMIKSKLLKKIDTSKLHFFKDLYPHLVNNYYDPHNEYSVPFFWSIYGIAIDKDYFGSKLPEPSWNLIFDPALIQPHTAMIDDARELILIAGRYLYKDQPLVDAKQFEAIKQLLLQQKKWIEVYTEDRANFLLASKSSPVAVILGAVVSRIMKQYKNIAFLIPEEGSFMVIDSFVMPISSTKDELVYSFLNYVYTPDVLKYYIKKYGYFSPLTTVQSSSPIIELPNQEQFKKIQFFKNNIPKKELSDIWIALKA